MRGLRLTRVRFVPLAGEALGFDDLIPTYVAVKSLTSNLAVRQRFL